MVLQPGDERQGAGGPVRDLLHGGDPPAVAGAGHAAGGGRHPQERLAGLQPPADQD